MVEALNTCRKMHTTHNKKQHMHEYAHAEGEQANKESGYREGGNKEHTDTQTQRGSAQTTNTHTQTCSAHQAQESSHKKGPRQKQHKVQSNNGKEPQYIHYTDSYFVLDMCGV